jgi:structural protein KPP10_ORF10
MATYSFIDISASLDGPTGTADLGFGSSIAKEGISVNMANPKNTRTIGADGKGMHSLHADKSGDVIVRALKTSPLNAILMAMYDAQSVNAALWGQNVIVVRQNQSGDITTCNQCAFTKKPDIKYAEDADILEWGFEAIEVDTVLGTY